MVTLTMYFLTVSIPSIQLMSFSYFHFLINLLWIFFLSSPFACNCLSPLLKIPLHISASVLLPQSLYSYIHFEVSFSSWYFSLCLPLADHFSPSMPRCCNSSSSPSCFTCLNLQLHSFHRLCSLLPSAYAQICTLFSTTSALLFPISFPGSSIHSVNITIPSATSVFSVGNLCRNLRVGFHLKCKIHFGGCGGDSCLLLTLGPLLVFS